MPARPSTFGWRRRLETLPALLAVGSLGLACALPTPGVRGGGDVGEPEQLPDSEPPLPTCEAVPASSWAHDTSTRCGHVLLASEGKLSLRSLEGNSGESQSEAAMWSGSRPVACANGGCDYELANTPAGFLILAKQRGLSEDRPASIWLGGPGSSAFTDAETAFVPLWPDGRVRVDSSDFGPAFELTPWLCGERVLLRLNVREPSAELADAPEELLARVSESPEQAGASPCEPVDLHLP
jgi:hypothetical protein